MKITMEQAKLALQKYIEEHKNNVITAKKSNNVYVYVRLANEGETIKSINKNGITEGFRTILPNEQVYVLTRCDKDGVPILNKEGNPNVWTSNIEKFFKNYNFDKEIGLAVPISMNRHFLKAEHDMVIPCKWSDTGFQKVSKGDYIRIDDSSQNAIGKHEFEETYIIINENHKNNQCNDNSIKSFKLKKE